MTKGAVGVANAVLGHSTVAAETIQKHRFQRVSSARPSPRIVEPDRQRLATPQPRHRKQRGRCRQPSRRMAETRPHIEESPLRNTMRWTACTAIGKWVRVHGKCSLACLSQLRHLGKFGLCEIIRTTRFGVFRLELAIDADYGRNPVLE